MAGVPREAHEIYDEEEKTMDVIVMSPHKINYIDPKFKKVKAKMYDFQCDVKLRVEASNYKAHKDVLSDASDYFSAMFSHDMLEKEQDVIDLYGVSPNGFSIILDYFYHGYVTIENDSVEDVLEAARFFQVDWLVEVCSHYMVHGLSIENYQTVLSLSDKYWLGDLRGDIFHFLGCNIRELSAEKGFYENFDLELLIQFLKSDNNIYIEAEEEFILELILKWVAADNERRQDYFLPMLRLVRFPLMQLESLKTLPASVLKSPEIQDFVEEAKYYHNNVPKQSLFKGDRFMPRGAKPNVVMFNLSYDDSIILYKDIQSGSRCEEMLAFTGTEMTFDSSSTVRVGNFLYRSGGYTQDMTSTDTMFRFDPRSRDWTILASMKEARALHAMCASEKHLFVVGGIHHFVGENGDEDIVLNSTELCDISENVWRELPNFPSGIHSHAGVFHDDRLYISGGISDDPHDNVPMMSLLCLNLNTESWEHKADMQYQRQSHSMTAYNDALYVFGGYTAMEASHRFDQPFCELYACEMYNIETNQWTEICSIPETFGHVHKVVGLWEGRFFFYADGYLHSYYADEDRMEFGNYFGMSIQKIACLSVAYPPIK